MSSSTLAGTVTIGITLDQAAYGSTLIITNLGYLRPGESGGSGTALYADHGSDSIMNEGTIIGTSGASGNGVLLANGASLTNEGTIMSVGQATQGNGVYVLDGTFTNYGTVIGGTDASNGNMAAAIRISGGSVENEGVLIGRANASDSGEVLGDGALVGSQGLLVNNGFIYGGSAAPFSGGSGADAVYLNGGTLINSGEVDGGNGATNYEPPGHYTDPGPNGDAVRFGSLASTLIVEPNAIFSGNVEADNAAADVLVLGSAATGGTLDGFGTSFTGFSTVTFATGGSWLLDGSATSLEGPTIEGFGLGETILVDGLTSASDTFVSGSGLSISNGSTTDLLNITGDFSTASFVVVNTALGTEVSLLCYVSGTRISTPAGEIPIEALTIGDTVITRFNGYRRIKWIGRQSFTKFFIKENRDQIPVRICADALGSRLPRHDLAVSPGHSMLIGNQLILARNLVNGVTICQDECPDQLNYYQLEFDTHDCILAEGVWSESFCDYSDLRDQFHNVSDFYRLYPDHVTPTEHLLCAPRPDSGPALEAALRPIVAYAASHTIAGPLRGWVDENVASQISGWAQDAANPQLPVLLEIVVNGRRVGSVLACDYRPDLAAAEIAMGRCAFTFRYTDPCQSTDISLQVRRVTDSADLPFILGLEKKLA